ncbi:MAG: Sec-independent protein translocase TatA [Flavobacterium sp. MedPE-SWcel]|uniref:Sec-independent protein translocase subunit TatA/TatB n=1 Tax=uncultured Flavobacterium sp. TaxID=165435 RepID=UPI00091BA69E|nr:twin-arginine translocase TatA/TatE family subunit [uncultured Flavobacterium sp.]OIQ22548.1 MAG: Sec-independent protein translocase TatA [Flavobacterium sp. MedPE-SWcel]
MFGIGGGELFFVILVVLMLFGSDKVPEMARALGKGMQQLKSATNDIKTEINKTAEIDDIKKSITDIGKGDNNVAKEMTEEVNKIKEDIEDLSGPIKRMR